jgi:AraC family transcriptional regulator
MAFHIETELHGLGIEASLWRVRFPATVLAAKAVSDDNNIVLYMEPGSFHGEVRCTDLGFDDFKPARSCRFRPAGVPYEWRELSGHSAMLNFSFSEDRLRQALDSDVVWNAEQLERGFDLGGTKVAPLLNMMLSEITCPDLGSRALSDALATVIIVELTRHLRAECPERVESGKLAPVQLSRIRERAAADIPAPSVGELARLCGMGERNLLRLFKATTGTTVSAYLKQIQVNRARNYLSTTDLPIKEIAFRLGFNHISNFVAAFHRSTQETPGTYRRRVGNVGAIPEGGSEPSFWPQAADIRHLPVRYAA